MENNKYCCIISECSSCDRLSKYHSKKIVLNPFSSALGLSSGNFDSQFERVSQGNGLYTPFSINKRENYLSDSLIKYSWLDDSHSGGMSRATKNKFLAFSPDEKFPSVAKRPGIDIENYNFQVPKLHDSNFDATFSFDGPSDTRISQGLRESQQKPKAMASFTTDQEHDKLRDTEEKAYRTKSDCMKKSSLTAEPIIEERADLKQLNEASQGSERGFRDNYSHSFSEVPNLSLAGDNCIYSQKRPSNRSIAASNTTLYKQLNRFLVENGLLQDLPENPPTQKGTEPVSLFANAFGALPISKKVGSRSNSSLLRNKLQACQTMSRPSTRIQRHKCSHRLWNDGRDNQVLVLVKKYGQNWEKIAKEIGHPLITGSMISDRYKKKLNPDPPKVSFSLQEDQIIAEYYKKHGPNWKLLAKYLPGRTEKMVRDRFYSVYKKKGAEFLEIKESCSSLIERDQANKENFEDDYNKIDETLESIAYHSGKKTKRNRRKIYEIQEPSEKKISMLFTPQPRSREMEIEAFNNSKKFDRSPSVEEVQVPRAENGLEPYEIITDSSLSLFEINREIFCKGSQDAQFECVSPLIDSRLPAEWGNYRQTPSENNSRSYTLSPKVSGFETDNSAIKRCLEKENYFDNLIEFDQKQIQNQDLSPSIEFLDRIEESESNNKDSANRYLEERVFLQSECDRQFIDSDHFVEEGLSKTNPLTEIDPRVPNSVSHLVNKIKSIQTLFNLTVNEIQKWQDQFTMSSCL